jgi:outer membrane immunogenic protein
MRQTTLALFVAAGLAVVTAQTASAADLPRREPIQKAPPPVARIYDWTGFYFGGHLGGAWSSEDAVWTATAFSTGTDPSGFLGGFQVGANWQNGNWVFGVEADWSWTNTDGSGTLGTASFTADHNWYATAAARVGYAWDNWLWYVKGGGAWLDADYSFGGTRVGDTRSGWLVGTGLEWGLGPNWSGKLEYNYMDFGSDTFGFPAAVNVDTQVHAIKAGLNYRFPLSGPVGVRY